MTDLAGLDQLAEGGELLFEADDIFAFALWGGGREDGVG